MEGCTITGTVEKLVFSNPGNGYTVLHLRDNSGNRVTAVGTMPPLEDGAAVTVSGRWVENARFGRQFEVATVAVKAPEGVDGLLKYLTSGAIPGIGREMATRLLAHFGPDLARVLDDEPDRLMEVSGIGPKRKVAIAEGWQRQSATRTSMLYLYGLGLGSGVIHKLMKTYGPMAPQVVKSNPYRLVKDIWGIGFLTADAIGRAVGIEKDSPKRIRAGLSYMLAEASGQGHVYLPKELLVGQATPFLEVDEAAVKEGLAGLLEEGDLVEAGPEEDHWLYSPRMAEAETRLADNLLRLARTHRPLPTRSLDLAVEAGADDAGVQLTEAQELALRSCLEKGLTIITGGPGTGKTTLLKAVVTAMGRLSLDCTLCAPTGRASKRMSEATGVPAKTIHRLLEFDPKAEVFGRNEERPLEHDAVIVDEVSMIDLPLMDSLLRAIRDRCRLILVGDPNQLQSVGPGAVLADCMSSGAFPVVTLDIVHRQAQESSIIRSSHRILRGENPELDEKGGDLFFVEREDAAKARDTIVTLVTQRIPESFGLNPVNDIQVLTPMYRGELGADSLNEALQAALNPGEGGVRRGQFLFRRGDKVMQIRNNYEKEVFNGDIGRVVEYDQAGSSLLVDFGGKPVLFEEDSLDELTLAYAVTVHKSQGSEYPAVVLALHSQHFIMLRRNLLYTALTRGRKLVVMVGRRQSLYRAVKNDDAGVRYSGLAWRIKRSLEEVDD